MAISFSQEIKGVYPAYNDSFVTLGSDKEGVYKLGVVTYPSVLFEKEFEVFSFNGEDFLFNLKEIVKVVFSKYGFDSVDLGEGVFFGSFEGAYLLQKLDFKIYYEGGVESISKEFEFYKGVKQIGDFISENEQRILSFSEDGVSNNVTYFEGFPFSFSVLKVDEGSVLSIKNKNTTGRTPDIEIVETKSFKCVVDDGLNNWTNKSILPLITGLNKLELSINNSFKSNINITKKVKDSGVYLRWFNGEGEYSYFLFNEYYKNVSKSNGLGRVYDTDFKNIGDSIGNSRSKGKETFKSKKVKANFNADEYGVLESLLASPLIQMYTSEKAFVKGRFIDVDIDGTLNYSNKRGKNEINLTIELTDSININL